MSPRLLLLEFNELVPALVDRFIAQGLLPNFARLRSESLVAVTDAEEQHPTLEPWIQWVTVHTGLSYAEHRVFNLDDGAKFDAPRIWDLVSDAGRPVWICGSMNAAVRGGRINGLVLPDPWTTLVAAQPPGLFDPYLDLVRAYVHGHTSDSGADGGALLRFGRFMLTNGLSVATVTSTVGQLANELRRPVKWRRAAILDRLQWDLFRHFYRRTSPALATFFLNSTAHFQHYYWRDMEPELFAASSEADKEGRFSDAIAFGYRKMDRIVGDALQLADEHTSIALCTALSQQPMLTHEDTGGKRIFKPHDHARLFAFAGVEDRYEFAPVMAEQFHLVFADEAAARRAKSKIDRLVLSDGTQLMLARLDGNRIFSGCALEAAPDRDARVISATSNEALDFSDLFYAVEAARSGMHHPDGMLWIRTPERRHLHLSRKVSLRELAPTFLELAGVQTSHVFARPALAEIRSQAPLAA